MNSFLYKIAQVYFQKHDAEITDFTFIFPNRRAGLFFQRYLALVAGKPIFSPRILTVNECFSEVSTCLEADRLSMLFTLYRIYVKNSNTSETFDTFVFWGEMLLSDFNEVDKYRVDAHQLFTNITDLHQIDELFNVFSDNQIEAIRQFWTSFTPVVEGKSHEDFIATWKLLHKIYTEFREALISENKAYEGMISRDVTDRLLAKEEIPFFEQGKFVFVGFNALNPCEKVLFQELKKKGVADFYWDYEAVELRDTENHASRYYVENTTLFPSMFDITTVLSDNDSLQNKDIRFYSVSSAVGQAKQVYNILDQLTDKKQSQLYGTSSAAINTAVVLPDETLLIPMLHSIPPQIDKINVTMGYPLKATPVSGLIDCIFELNRRMIVNNNHTSFYHLSVSNILNHQYLALVSAHASGIILSKMSQFNWLYVDKKIFQNDELLSVIFSPPASFSEYIPYLLKVLETLQQAVRNKYMPDDKVQLELDYLYQFYITLNRINVIIKDEIGEIDMNIETLQRLIRQLSASINIPFIGEPLDGLQLMGVLESRGIDFENLIITSFNEGVFPQKSVTNSFIPYNLRRGFDLPTIEHQDAITAYNFYRLIHRAKNVYFLCDSRSDGLQTGEVSRFYYQLIYHYKVPVEKIDLAFDISINKNEPLVVHKSPLVLNKLNRYLADDSQQAFLSATAIDTYLSCPLQFYFTYIEKLKEADEVVETIEADMFGKIFHYVMEKIYQPFEGQLLDKDGIREIARNRHLIDKLINQAFAKVYFRKAGDELIQLEGNNLLIATVIRKYVTQVLKIDMQYAPFKYCCSEEKIMSHFPVFNATKMVNLMGVIDRVDEKEGCLRIVDYKTGKGKLQFKELPEAFDRENKKRLKFVLQTFLYGLIYKQNRKLDKKIKPAIYLMREIFKKDNDVHLTHKTDDGNVLSVSELSQYEEEFTLLMRNCLEEIFSPEIAFVQTQYAENCKYCSFRTICAK